MPRKGENIYLRKDGRWKGVISKGADRTEKPVFGSYLWETVWTGKKRLVLIKSEIYQDHSSVGLRQRQFF